MSSPPQEWIKTSDLRDWKLIGCGGFGEIYKARHRPWVCDVAIKFLCHDDRNGSSLLREVRMMHEGSNPHVIRVFGIVSAKIPDVTSPTRLGLVMEFMEKGSLDFLLKALQSPPPWPLLFRLAHQVSLGINFLHSRTPAVLHLDLKPSNVLLDSYLNTKLTDFGLAKIESSLGRKKDSEQEPGTISFMPPEAFNLSYTPSKTTDIYSYGVLLWCIATGKQPYKGATSTMVRFRIPKGDRPSLDEIDCHDVLAELRELMIACWQASPDKRPSSHKCTLWTEELYEKHKHDIDDVVHEVLIKLKEKEAERKESFPSSGPGSTRDENVYVPTGPPPVQEIVSGLSGIQLRDKDSSQHQKSSKSSKSSESSRINTSSVRPVTSSASRSKEDPSTSQGKQHKLQSSNPNLSSSCSQPFHISIHSSNVSVIQQGNNNYMHIVTSDPSGRRRHRTAPSGINRPSPK